LILNDIILLNYRPNGLRRLGRPLKRLLDEAETGVLYLIVPMSSYARHCVPLC